MCKNGISGDSFTRRCRFLLLHPSLPGVWVYRFGFPGSILLRRQIAVSPRGRTSICLTNYVHFRRTFWAGGNSIDISTLSFKRQVNQIILISGDSDFVPAAKHARREGIDFILNSLGAPIKEDLFEHIDGLIKTGVKLPDEDAN